MVKNIVGRWFKIIACGAAIAGCKDLPRNDSLFSQLACDNGRCIDGYVCNPELNICAKEIKIACDGEGVCPSTVRTNHPCETPDTFIPCTLDGLKNCDGGCRTCIEDQSGDKKWSECSHAVCYPGELNSCASCTDDCAQSVLHATPLCAAAATPVHCDYTTCTAGFGDADGDRKNGCECTRQNNNTEIACNGIDEDCNGADSVLTTTVDHCGACNSPCTLGAHATTITCDTGAGAPACLITGCGSGWIDADHNPANGCERACSPTNGGVEICDALDNDCNGTADDLSQTAINGACNAQAPGSHVLNWQCSAGSCQILSCQSDYYNNDVFVPGCEYFCAPANAGTEVCDNGQDNDCDGKIDVNDDSLLPAALDCQNQYGTQPFVNGWTCNALSPPSPIGACKISSCQSGHSDGNGNPSDGCESTCVPSGAEACDGIDNDCDGVVDNQNATGCTVYYRDNDNDNFGLSGNSRCLCDPSGAYKTTAVGDCNDLDIYTYPGATERCDGNVNNCNNYPAIPAGEIDDDGDGYVECIGWVDTQADNPAITAGGDCDDNPSLCGNGCRPGNASADVCDGKNQDCDAQTDEDINLTWYHDADGDGFTKNSDSQSVCSDPDGVGANWVATASATTDCDDNPAACGSGCYPGNSAPDICDGRNQDCDAQTDENPNLTWYHDADGDGFTNNSDTQANCSDPDAAGINWRSNASATSDCNDGNAAVNPGATETVADGVDRDCNGQELCYKDSDDDTYRPDGTATVVSLLDLDCADSGEAVGTDPTGDCNDAAPLIHPGVTEGVDNGVDQNCDGFESCFKDTDNDDYRPDATQTVSSSDLDCIDSGEAVATDSIGDCNDANPAIHPGAVEGVADGVDQDCNSQELCYKDTDNDTYRPDATTTVASLLNLNCTDSGEAIASDPIGDCNDNAAGIYPGAAETLADGIDQNCDDVDRCYQDLDNDDYGTATQVNDTDLNCLNSSALTSAVSSDCNDAAVLIHPGAAEIVDDGVDEDCNSQELCYKDTDNDTYRPDATTTVASVLDLDCVDNGEALNSDPIGDCNDNVASIFPGAPEVIADGVDQNCDSVDRCYQDLDDDGFGTVTEVNDGDLSCTNSSDLTSNVNTDCNDGVAAIRPNATEIVADGVDQNCNNQELCYKDTDNDSYRPDATTTVVSLLNLNCSDSGEALASDPIGDCNDSVATIYPSAPETVADGIDQDCNTQELCYKDSDNDNHRPDATSTVVSPINLNCTDSGEAVPTDPVGDCNDAVATIYVGATEVIADGIDQNCDNVDRCYEDLDNDEYGSIVLVNDTDLNCSNSSALTSAVNTDCNDGVAAINPSATELVDDGVDQNCNSQELCYKDSDNDTYRPDATTTVVSTNLVCTDAGEAVTADPIGDCNDAIGSIHPGAAEVIADSIDQNCDDVDRCYEDLDDDGYGTTAQVNDSDLICTNSSAFTSNVSTDCNDGAATVFPTATEVVNNGVDEDCNSQELCYKDTDNDTYRPNASATVISDDLDCDDDTEAVSADLLGDCNDNVASVHPNATEVVNNGVDEDCNSQELCYKDTDNDGHRPDGTATVATISDLDCADSGEAVGSDPVDDCNDAVATIYSGAPEVIADGIDQNCDNVDRCYQDLDDDGYGSTVQINDTDLNCTNATDLTSNVSTDCNDAASAILPGATEIPDDGTDQNCDNNELCYKDTDNDGYRPDGTSTVTSTTDLDCVDNGEAVGSDPVGDCNDNSASLNPGVTEVCDFIDNNCGAGIDDGLGAACGCTGGVAPKSLDICSDGIDNNCNIQTDEFNCWWNCSYDYRKSITVTVADALPAGYSVKVSFNHATLVSGGKSLSSGNDLRVVYDDGLGGFELDRVLDPDSAWNNATTTVWFKLPNALSASDTTHFFLYYGNPAAVNPPASEGNVFVFADFFNRTNAAAIGNGWTESELGVNTAGCGTNLGQSQIDINANALYYTKTYARTSGCTADIYHQPYVSHTFTAQTTRFAVGVGWNWLRDDEGTYYIYIQVGNNPAAPSQTVDAPPTSGIGPNVVGAGQAQFASSTGCSAGTTNGSNVNFGYIKSNGNPCRKDQISGYAKIEMRINPAASGTFDLLITRSGTTTTYSNLEFSTAQTTLNTIRLMLNQLGQDNWTATRQFEWMWIRRDVVNQPTISLGTEVVGPC